MVQIYAFSILILIIFTFGIGVTFHGLLLVGVYSNCGTPIAYWLAQQIMSIILNLTLLVCLVIYSRNIVFMLLQSARIAFSLHCVMIVSRHHRSLYGSLDAKPIDAV
ncbi:uncharacterized protein LOC111047393 [Nilaparvata lugens]|uniref:uncharacterized protein LOC111047393 n=1 Tax=Nilaparvata lugens TaxID=108931 RepID=UPI00193DF166|nr:uncharacterized protein LOC111047393 [Nilaparvata lugens]